MHEKDANQVVAEAICSTMRWEGQEFRLGEGVALLDGKVVAVGEDLEAVLRALRAIDPDPKRGMVLEVAPLSTEDIRCSTHAPDTIRGRSLLTATAGITQSGSPTEVKSRPA